MERIAFKLKGLGYILRSGAAAGADDAFWQGVCRYYSDASYEGDPNWERPEGIYLPWDGFNDFEVDHPWDCFSTPFCKNKSVGFEARRIAERLHPNWEACSKGAKAMHSRNVLQVLGDDLNTPSKFLICWAKTRGDGISGGTAMAWSIAEEYGVPCFNLNNKIDLTRIEDWLC